MSLADRIGVMIVELIGLFGIYGGWRLYKEIKVLGLFVMIIGMLISIAMFCELVGI